MINLVSNRSVRILMSSSHLSSSLTSDTTSLGQEKITKMLKKELIHASLESHILH